MSSFYLPDELVRLINEFAKPVTRLDWRKGSNLKRIQENERRKSDYCRCDWYSNCGSWCEHKLQHKLLQHIKENENIKHKLFGRYIDKGIMMTFSKTGCDNIRKGTDFIDCDWQVTDLIAYKLGDISVR